MMAVNVKGTFLGVRHGVPALRRRGGGVILNTASVSALVPRRRSAMHAASKGAVVTMTQALAVDLAPEIRVNCVCPVAAQTRFQEGLSTDPGEVAERQERTKAAGASIPMKRIATPEDVADAFAYLASPGAGFLTGVILPVDGGRSAGDPT
jgi:3-oxoacyl-[acyl-carrier protein] reductase